MKDTYSMPAIERPSASKHGSGHSTTQGYRLEVRTSSFTPKIIGGSFVIDGVWRTVPVQEGSVPFGLNVPVTLWDREMLIRSGLVSRVAVEAFRWGFLAAMEASTPGGALCLETRLVKVELKVSYSTEEKGVSDVVSAPFGATDKEFHPRPPFVNEITPPVAERVSESTT